MRILHCVRAPIGGIYRHVEDLALEQTRAGHSVGVILDRASGGAFENARVDELGRNIAFGVIDLRMHRLPSPRDATALMGVMRQLRRLEPDVLHGHGAKGGAYARLIGSLSRSRRVARIYAPHGGSLHYDEKTLAGRAFFAIEGGLERVTDGLVFVSEYEAQAYAAKIGEPRRPVCRVRNGIRPEELELIAPRPDAVDFLMIGLLRDIKGPDVYLRALAELPPIGGRLPTGLVVGDGPDLPAYRALAQELGLGERVRFLPPMPAREAMAMARAIVVPSRAEASPYIVFESVAAGMPIVASRVGGIPEFLDQPQDPLVPPGDPRALAGAMAGILADPEGHRTAAMTRRERLTVRHTVRGMARRITAFYAEAVPELQSR